MKLTESSFVVLATTGVILSGGLLGYQQAKKAAEAPPPPPLGIVIDTYMEGSLKFSADDPQLKDLAGTYKFQLATEPLGKITLSPDRKDKSLRYIKLENNIPFMIVAPELTQKITALPDGDVKKAAVKLMATQSNTKKSYMDFTYLDAAKLSPGEDNKGDDELPEDLKAERAERRKNKVQRQARQVAEDKSKGLNPVTKKAEREAKEQSSLETTRLFLGGFIGQIYDNPRLILGFMAQGNGALMFSNLEGMLKKSPSVATNPTTPAQPAKSIFSNELKKKFKINPIVEKFPSDTPTDKMKIEICVYFNELPVADFKRLFDSAQKADQADSDLITQLDSLNSYIKSVEINFYYH